VARHLPIHICGRSTAERLGLAHQDSNQQLAGEATWLAPQSDRSSNLIPDAVSCDVWFFSTPFAFPAHHFQHSGLARGSLQPAPYPQPKARLTADSSYDEQAGLTGRRFDESSSIADRSKHGDREGTHNFKLEGKSADSRGLDRSEARSGPGARAAASPEAQGFLALAIWLNVIAGRVPAFGHLRLRGLVATKPSRKLVGTPGLEPDTGCPLMRPIRKKNPRTAFCAL